MKVKLVVISSIFILSSCLGTRYLKEGESVLKKQRIKADRAINKDELDPLTTQTVNTRFLGLPIAPRVYIRKIGEKHFDSLRIVNKINKIEQDFEKKVSELKSRKKKLRLQSKTTKKLDKKKKKLSEGNLLMRWGEPLAVFDSVKLSQTKSNMGNYLFTHGYFNADVDISKLKTTNSRTKVTLKIDEGDHYVMDSISYLIKDEKVKELFFQNVDDELLRGKQYNQDLITAERERVYNIMTNNGYYDFKRQYILFAVDSTALDNNRLIIRETIGNPPGRKNHKEYRIDSVIFTTNSNSSANLRKTPSRYNNRTYQLNNNRYYERVIDWRLFIYQDSLYSKSNALQTQKQLSYLDMFKFVNINYDTTGGEFIVNIFTSPLKKYQTGIETGVSKLDQAQLPGPFVNFNLKNRNILKGLEILQFDGNVSIQDFKGRDKEVEDKATYSRFEYGGTFSLTFPQFLAPLKNAYKAKIGQYNPKTVISSGVSVENRIDEYKRVTFNSAMRYTWQVSDNSQFTFRPLGIGYIKTEIDPNDTIFINQLISLEEAGNISYVSAFRSSFISSSLLSLDVNFNNYGIYSQNSSFIHSSLEYGGTGQSLLNLIPVVKKETNFKYIKANIDYRQNIILSKKASFAYRANLGVAYTFGKSKALPYEKYYFAGGSNSIRAWQPRRLGPGSYALYDSLDNSGNPIINYNREQPGDILLEISAELRHQLAGIVDYALFVDAGNIWLWRSKTIENNEDPQRDNGRFKANSFVGEIAVGAGAGLRLDFSFLILRLDGAYKVYDPGRAKGDRFVLDEVNFKNFGPGRGKMNLNIGIGYPF
ncbi:MAG: BamA/TamA family outer membrane protein [Cyclobacteriaceae bacterium]